MRQSKFQGFKSTSNHRTYAKSKDLIYQPQFVDKQEKSELFDWIETLRPIWEMRYSQHRPPPNGKEQRRLLRPVYWLGNWQFACLDYFHPPKNIYNCCVEAEPFSPILQGISDRISEIVHQNFMGRNIPQGWHFNTCLINFYGDQITLEGRKLDVARVGEHKDFEPGPVGSLSFGERALFQFVKSEGQRQNSQVVCQQWLEDSSLQIFGGDFFKRKLFHRVQRVESKKGISLGPPIDGFHTRRINLTFRYVPREFIVPFYKLPFDLQMDIHPYIEALSKTSKFFESILNENKNY